MWVVSDVLLTLKVRSMASVQSAPIWLNCHTLVSDQSLAFSCNFAPFIRIGNCIRLG
jgi:hypothetical protein